MKFWRRSFDSEVSSDITLKNSVYIFTISVSNIIYNIFNIIVTEARRYK